MLAPPILILVCYIWHDNNAQQVQDADAPTAFHRYLGMMNAQ